MRRIATIALLVLVAAPAHADAAADAAAARRVQAA